MLIWYVVLGLYKSVTTLSFASGWYTPNTCPLALERYGSGQVILEHSIKTEVSFSQSDLLTGLPGVQITSSISPPLDLRIVVFICLIPWTWTSYKKASDGPIAVEGNIWYNSELFV